MRKLEIKKVIINKQKSTQDAAGEVFSRLFLRHIYDPDQYSCGELMLEFCLPPIAYSFGLFV